MGRKSCWAIVGKENHTVLFIDNQSAIYSDSADCIAAYNALHPDIQRIFEILPVWRDEINNLAAFKLAKSQQNPLQNVDENGKSTIGMSLQASADDKHFVDVTLSNPSYVAISPERLAELERIEALYNERIELLGENVNPDALWEKMQQNADKAAKWDTFGPKMRYIINTFEDLEGLKS